MRLTETRIRSIVRRILSEAETKTRTVTRVDQNVQSLLDTMRKPKPTIDIDRMLTALEPLIRNAVREAGEILRGDIEEMARRLSEPTVPVVGDERYELENSVFDGSFNNMWETLNNSPSPSCRVVTKLLEGIVSRLVGLSGDRDPDGEYSTEAVLAYLNESIVQEIIPPMPDAVGWRTYREKLLTVDQERLASHVTFEQLRQIISLWINEEIDTIADDILRASVTNDPDLTEAARLAAESLAQRINAIKMTEDGQPVARSILRGIKRDGLDARKQAVGMVMQGLV